MNSDSGSLLPRAVVAGILLVVVIVAALVLEARGTADLAEQTAVINATGKQRYRVERVALSGLRLFTAEGESDRELARGRLADTLDELLLHAQSLEYHPEHVGVPGTMSHEVSLSPEAIGRLDAIDVEERFDQYVARARALATTPDNELSGAVADFRYVVDNEPRVLEAIDAVVLELANEVDAKRNRTLLIGQIATVLELLVVALVAAFVFVPLVQRLQTETTRLTSSEERFRSFFEMSRSAMFIEDFSSLEVWFDDLRAEGVVDLSRYFDDHPGELEAQVGRLRILDANQAAADLYEAGSRTEMCQHLRPEALGDEGLDAFRARIISLWRGHNRIEFDTWARSLKGNEFAALLQSVVPAVDGHPDLSRVMVSVTDLSRHQALIDELRTKHAEAEKAHTELATAHQELVQAQKLESIGSLAAGIAHEINTPTQYVGDNARFLQDTFQQFMGLHETSETVVAAAEANGLLIEETARYRAALDESGIDFWWSEIPLAMEQTLEGVGQIATIVRALKDFSHPGSESMAPVDINRALSSTITVARNEWKYVAEVVTDLDPDLPLVPAAAGRLNQVFLNLIVNAAHAIGDVVGDGAGGKGTISVRTRAFGDAAEIAVSDTGCGIPDEIRDRIFDPFFTTKGVGKGTGQGLSIARSVIIEQHQGQLDVQSEPGHGTTFTIRLPLHQMPDGDVS